LEAIPTPVRNTSELESAMAAQARTPNGGLVLMTDSFLVTHRAKITSLAARYRLPVVYPFRDFIELGGLLSYGNDLYDNFRRGATYADRILKGATPNELPVQAPVKFELSSTSGRRRRSDSRSPSRSWCGRIRSPRHKLRHRCGRHQNGSSLSRALACNLYFSAMATSR